MTRTPQEIFAHHASALMAGDVDGIVADYAEDAVLITPAGAVRCGARDRLPAASWERGRPGRLPVGNAGASPLARPGRSPWRSGQLKASRAA